MIFTDRIEAGNLLSDALFKYKNLSNVVVIGLPRGGVIVAQQVAKNLNVPLDVTCPRKISAPYSPEYAIGAITETGEGILNKEAIAHLSISQNYIDQAIREEKTEAINRIERFRKGQPPRDLKNQIVIIVDDGLATGYTMKAAIQSIKTNAIKKLIIAVPVSPADTLEEIRLMVDEVICLTVPSLFQAVGQFYQHFDQTTDNEVIKSLEESRGDA